MVGVYWVEQGVVERVNGLLLGIGMEDKIFEMAKMIVMVGYLVSPDGSSVDIFLAVSNDGKH